MSSICCIRKRLKGSQCSQQLVFKKKKKPKILCYEVQSSILYIERGA